MLRAKGEGMKRALMEKDIQKAVDYFTDWTKERYANIFEILKEYLPQIVQEMQDIKMIYIQGDVAKYRIRRMETAGEITYYIYFVKDKDGLWKIQDF